MSDDKVSFIPGTVAQEPISGNEYVLCEVEETFKKGDPAAMDNFGVAHKLPDEVKVGVFIAPLYAYEYIPKEQKLGWFIKKGATFAQKRAKQIRAEEKAKSVIDTTSKIAVPGQVKTQTRKIPVGAIKK